MYKLETPHVQSRSCNCRFLRLNRLLLQTINHLNHTQLAPVVFATFGAAVVRQKANDGVVYAIWAWFKYNTALSAVV